MFHIFSIFLLISGCFASTVLEQVHVVFRHGDRTPDAIGFYPTDPYLNDTWYPEGLSALTKLGKVQEYTIGLKLRERYNKFLGQIYTPEVMDAWSTSMNRTKMSLELTLAGLWPPAPSQIWNTILNWQPIPYNYLPAVYDMVLAPPLLHHCPKFHEEHKKITKLDEFQEYLTSNADLLEYIYENTRKEVNDFWSIMILYFHLFTEEKTGRALPEWTQKVYPEFLEYGTVLNYHIQTYNNIIRKYSGGYLLKKVINDLQNKIQGTLVPKDRKLFLYSGHEYNVAHFLAAINIFKPHIPPYSAYVILELHKKNGTHAIRIYYQDYKQLNPKLMIIPGCEKFCEFNKFLKLTADVIPTDNVC